MKEIPLTQGKVALVDDEDFDYLSQWKWCANKNWHTFYARRAIYDPQQKAIYMHRSLLNAPDGVEIDHIDGNGLNNTRCNLRLCTRRQNRINSNKRNNTSSKYKGVSWSKDAQKWHASISLNGARKCLGFFPSEDEAALAYNWAAIGIHGRFARLNFLTSPLAD